jgi:hypothetical protein
MQSYNFERYWYFDFFLGCTNNLYMQAEHIKMLKNFPSFFNNISKFSTQSLQNKIFLFEVFDIIKLKKHLLHKRIKANEPSLQHVN